MPARTIAIDLAAGAFGLREEAAAEQEWQTRSLSDYLKKPVQGVQRGWPLWQGVWGAFGEPVEGMCAQRPETLE